MSTDIETHRQVADVLGQLGFKDTELTKDARLAEDLDIDSTELVEIVVALEKQFGVEIDTDAEETFVIFGDLVGCVARLRETKIHATAVSEG